MRGIEARQAERADLPLIAGFIRELAAYEKRADEAVFTEADLEATLFGDEKCAEVLLAYVDGEAGGFAVYFFAYSTFLARAARLNRNSALILTRISTAVKPPAPSGQRRLRRSNRSIQPSKIQMREMMGA